MASSPVAKIKFSKSPPHFNTNSLDLGELILCAFISSTNKALTWVCWMPLASTATDLPRRFISVMSETTEIVHLVTILISSCFWQVTKLPAKVQLEEPQKSHLEQLLRDFFQGSCESWFTWLVTVFKQTWLHGASYICSIYIYIYQYMYIYRER